MSGSVRSRRESSADNVAAEQSSDSQTVVPSTELRSLQLSTSPFAATTRGGTEAANVLTRFHRRLRTVNPFADKPPKPPKFRLHVPNSSHIDARIANEPVHGGGSPLELENAARAMRPAIREEEYDKWIQKYVDLVLSKTREFAHAQMEEHWIHVRKTRSRRTLQDYKDEELEQAGLVEQYYCTAFSRLVQEHLEAMDVHGVEERAEIGSTRLSHLKRTFDGFNPYSWSQEPGHLPQIRVSPTYVCLSRRNVDT
ncbi:hypothetical protein JCM3765_004495 [Sporobolomyces pararoseus]